MDDTIKRSDVLSTISRLTVDMSTDYFSTNYGVPHDELVDAINELEAVKERTAHWIIRTDANGHTYGECSECGMRQYAGTLRYCPECGAHMITED